MNTSCFRPAINNSAACLIKKINADQQNKKSDPVGINDHTLL